MAKTKNTKSNEEVVVKKAIIRFTKDKAYEITFNETTGTAEMKEV